jgi:hypothetical protein
MAEQKPDDLAAELVPDPTNLPDLVVLSGYLGKSTRAGFSRLYVDVSFTEFVEVADEDVLARRSLAADQDPLGGTVLWVKRSAALLRATVSSAQEHAAFLRGEITASRQSQMELPVGRKLAEFGVQRGGPTDPLYYSTCRGPACEDPPHHRPGGCCLGPRTTIR